ncbi:uncharacterized protein [Eleutherodactylus coqui]|uniref:uncharacterized protein n=1 Tax=Eleutherodactylus coqui TaxID=57060 RepID=UPI0034628120
MMDCGRKTLIVLTLCALVGANKVQQLVTILDILFSVPSTHIGDTEIVSNVLTLSAAHPFRYTVVAKKNQTKCIDSTDPLCPSLIQPPVLDVPVSSRASNGKTTTYSNSISGSLALAVHVSPEVSVRPQMVNDGSDTITILLDITHNENNTRRGSFSSRLRPTVFTFKAEYTTAVLITTTEEQNNGEPTLRSAPLCALLLPALLPVLLLK